MYSRGISTCDTFAMRLRAGKPLRKVKEEAMHSIAEATQTLAAEYNGWTNRETWVVNLWLTNDECYYQELRSIIKNFDSDEQAEEIEQYVHWIIDVDESSMTSDLLSTSLGRVNWYEIAEANRE